MPAHMVGLPVSATNLSISREGESYPLLLDTDTFDRAGEDGDIPVLPLNGGDEFVGEALEGQWHKGLDANIDTFTATINSGVLRLTGVAKVAGTAGIGWINSHHPIPMLDGLELTVSMEVPVDDTGITANRDIVYGFFLKQDKNEVVPTNDNNYINIRTLVNENGLILYLRKRVNGIVTTLDSGYDYTMDGTQSTGNLEATIWRLVFNGKPGTPGATLSVYLKQSDTLANAETATENELDGSPYDISDLAFVIGYPSYRIYTQNTTYFGATYDSANRAASTYLRVNYDNSPFKVHYDFTPADYGEGDVMLFDGDPDSGGVRVYDEDHEFANDVYLQNGLIRLHLNEAVVFGCLFELYTGAAYTEAIDHHGYALQTSAKNLSYPHLVNVVYLSPEKIVLSIKLTDTASNDDDYYIIETVTLVRGAYYFKASPQQAYPLETTYLIHYNSPTPRFGYVGDNGIGDTDLAITGNNATLTDNFLIAFDDVDANNKLISLSTDKEPDDAPTRFQAFQGGSLYIQNYVPQTLLSTDFFLGFSQFSNVSNLFEEAEDGVLEGGASSDADAGASGGAAAKYDAQSERSIHRLTAGTDLPAGRYLAVFRMRDTNQVADDVGLRAWNQTDNEYRNREGKTKTITVTATYAYYGLIFDITDADATGTDLIKIYSQKNLADANTVYEDYILIIPIGNGMNWSQDLAHSALRGVTQLPRLCER